jgi:hypothetical protein
MPRETDPEARRLLAEVLRLQGEPWPDSLDAYSAALLALGTRCEQPAGKAEMFRWLSGALVGLLNPPDPQLREVTGDALANVVSTIDGRLYAFRAALDRRLRRPNLRSMLHKAVEWHAKDIAKSRYRRHDKRRVYVEPRERHLARLALHRHPRPRSRRPLVRSRHPGCPRPAAPRHRREHRRGRSPHRRKPAADLPRVIGVGRACSSER